MSNDAGVPNASCIARAIATTVAEVKFMASTFPSSGDPSTGRNELQIASSEWLPLLPWVFLPPTSRNGVDHVVPSEGFKRLVRWLKSESLCPGYSPKLAETLCLNDGTELRLGDALGHGSYASAFDVNYAGMPAVAKVFRFPDAHGAKGNAAVSQEVACMRAFASIPEPELRGRLPSLVAVCPAGVLMTPRGRPLAAVMESFAIEPFGDHRLDEPAPRDAARDWSLAVDVWGCLVRSLYVLHVRLRRSHGDLRITNVIQRPATAGQQLFIPIDFGLSQALTDGSGLEAMRSDLRQALDAIAQVAIGGMQSLPCGQWIGSCPLPGLKNRQSISAPSRTQISVAEAAIDGFASTGDWPTEAEYRNLEGLIYIGAAAASGGASAANAYHSASGAGHPLVFPEVAGGGNGGSRPRRRRAGSVGQE